MLETFVFAELQKQAGCSDEPPRPAFYLTRDGEEIDLLFERADGTLIAVEVKAAASVNAADFKGLRQLSAAVGKQLALGVVLYDGDVALPFADNLWAAPIACLFGV